MSLWWSAESELFRNLSRIISNVGTFLFMAKSCKISFNCLFKVKEVCNISIINNFEGKYEIKYLFNILDINVVILVFYIFSYTFITNLFVKWNTYKVSNVWNAIFLFILKNKWNNSMTKNI